MDEEAFFEDTSLVSTVHTDGKDSIGSTNGGTHSAAAEKNVTLSTGFNVLWHFYNI